MTELLIRPVAFVRSSRSSPEDDDWGQMPARIELAPDLPDDALEGVETFSHIEVLYHFNAVEPGKIIQGARHPRNNPDWPKVGIFAQRGKNRPNRLGSTICRVMAREHRVLHVLELDAIDGSPVIDIKPVMREFLPRSEVVQPMWSHELMRHYWSQRP
jgi:tRNA-Thr(GGU) m(6)t(6)A37 methyltransferase TsaA